MLIRIYCSGESEPPYRRRGRGGRGGMRGRGSGRRGGYHSEREGSVGMAHSDYSENEQRSRPMRGMRGGRAGWRRTDKNSSSDAPVEPINFNEPRERMSIYLSIS